MASITPQNGRVAFVDAWHPHTYWELNSTNLGTNYGDDTTGNDDNAAVTSGDISTQDSYDGMSNQNDPPASGWFDIYTVTDAAALIYIPAGLAHDTVYGLFSNGGGTNGQGGFLRATTTGVEIACACNSGGDNVDAVIAEIPDADLPGWFAVGFQFSSNDGNQGDMGLWINGVCEASGTRALQLAYGSVAPDFGNNTTRAPNAATVIDPASYGGGDWGDNTAITGSGVLIANFCCDNLNKTNTTPPGNGDSFHTDYYDEHITAATQELSPQSAVHALFTTNQNLTVNFWESAQDTIHGISGTHPEIAVEAGGELQVLTVQDSNLAVSGIHPDLITNFELSVQEPRHEVGVGTPALTAILETTPNDAVHGVSVDTPALTSSTIVGIRDAIHNISGTHPDVSTSIFMDVQKPIHSIFATECSLSGNFQAGANNAQHVVSGTHPNLVTTQAESLTVRDANHSIFSTDQSLSCDFQVSATDTEHDVSSTHPDLTVGGTKDLSIQSSEHGVISDISGLNANLEISIRNTEHVASGTHGMIVVVPTLGQRKLKENFTAIQRPYLVVSTSDEYFYTGRDMTYHYITKKAA